MPSVLATSARPRRRVLRRRPDLDLAVLEVRRAVLRLERRVGDERIGVGGLDDLRGAGERGVDVAVLAAASARGACFDELRGLRGEAGAALRWRRAGRPT